MNIKLLDRICIANFCENPYDNLVIVPIKYKKKQVKKLAEDYIRNLNIKEKKEFGYWKIKNNTITKEKIYESYMSNHPIMRIRYNNKVYLSWAISVDFIEYDEKKYREEERETKIKNRPSYNERLFIKRKCVKKNKTKKRQKQHIDEVFKYFSYIDEEGKKCIVIT